MLWLINFKLVLFFLDLVLVLLLVSVLINNKFVNVSVVIFFSELDFVFFIIIIIFFI